MHSMYAMYLMAKHPSKLEGKLNNKSQNKGWIVIELFKINVGLWFDSSSIFVLKIEITIFLFKQPIIMLRDFQCSDTPLTVFVVKLYCSFV